MQLLIILLMYTVVTVNRLKRLSVQRKTTFPQENQFLFFFCNQHSQFHGYKKHLFITFLEKQHVAFINIFVFVTKILM